MRTRGLVRAAVVAGLLAALPAAVRAAPAVVTNVGGTFGVLGGLGDGGFSFALSALWPLDDRLSFGIAGFADDLGADIGRLRDPNDGSDLGAVEVAHRSVLGAAWRMDAALGGERWGWTPYASGSWGVYRIADDHRGNRDRTIGSTGFSLAGGMFRALAGRGSMGAVIRYHRLFNDDAGRYWSAAAEWRWGGLETK